MTARAALILALAATGLTACVTAPAGAGPRVDEVAPPPEQTAEAEQEAIYSAAVSRAGLTVRVNSNGCTKREDFRAQVLDGYPAPTVILRRMKPDLCRAFVAGGVDLLFAWGDLGLAPTSQMVLANPLVADPTPGR